MNFDFSFVAFQCSGSIVFIFEKMPNQKKKNIFLHMGKEIPGRDTQTFWWGCLAQTFKSVRTPDQTKMSDFPYPIFRPKANKHALFQTSKVSEMRPFGTVALIVCAREFPCPRQEDNKKKNYTNKRRKVKIFYVSGYLYYDQSFKLCFCQ